MINKIPTTHHHSPLTTHHHSPLTLTTHHQDQEHQKKIFGGVAALVGYPLLK